MAWNIQEEPPPAGGGDGGAAYLGDFEPTLAETPSLVAGTTSPILGTEMPAISQQTGDTWYALDEEA